MIKCKNCGNYTINPYLHSETDLCSACYWRLKFESLQKELEAVKAENKILEENCVLSYKELRELLERR